MLVGHGHLCVLSDIGTEALFFKSEAREEQTGLGVNLCLPMTTELFYSSGTDWKRPAVGREVTKPPVSAFASVPCLTPQTCLHDRCGHMSIVSLDATENGPGVVWLDRAAGKGAAMLSVGLS